MSKSIAAFLLAFATLTISASAQSSSPELRVYHISLDFYRPQDSLATGLQRFATSSEGRSAISSVAAAFGADPRYVAIGLNLIPNISQRGEEFNGEVQFDRNYMFCRATKAGLVSSFGGASFGSAGGMSSLPDRGGVGIYAHVPQHYWTGGGSGVEVIIEAVGVRSDVAHRYNCWPSGTRILDCNGNACTRHPNVRTP